MRGSKVHGWRARARSLRRGSVVPQVAVCSFVLLGFAALAIDVGHMYDRRAELQRTADAAAHGAAYELGNYLEADPLANARAAAQEFCTRNEVFGEGVQLDQDTDVLFGRAVQNVVTGKYTFTPTEQFPNAARVRVRRTADSPSGSIPLFFARIFGLSEKDMSAEATAVLTPRDIVLVADLSASHTDDSEVKHCAYADVNLYDVWDGLPSGQDTGQKTDSNGFSSTVNIIDNGDGTSTIVVDVTTDGSGASLSHIVFGLPEGAWGMAGDTASSGGGYPIEFGEDPDTGVTGLKFDETSQIGEEGGIDAETFTFTIANGYLSEMQIGTKAGRTIDTSVNHELAPGPTFGNMAFWGTNDACGDPGSDDGLWNLPYDQTWFNPDLQGLLEDRGYNPAEVMAILSNTHDVEGAWPARVAVALGLARWASGIPGGLWEQTGDAPGNGNDQVGWSSELAWEVDYPYTGGGWSDYLNYMRYNNGMTGYDDAWHYKFGVKSFTNYLLEQQYTHWATPELADTPEQPMGAIKDAASQLVDIVDALESNDQLGLGAYGTVGYGPDTYPDYLSWLTGDLDSVKAKIEELQGGMFSCCTNIAQGIDEGVNILFNSPESRPHAAKVMLLLTDGIANQTRANPTEMDEAQARADTLAAAQDAADMGVRIYTVSVGTQADTDLMKQVAEIGHGEWFHAQGTVEEYQNQLSAIFESLGAKRAVALIE
jgi:Flp pilus assembly protein TadG